MDEHPDSFYKVIADDLNIKALIDIFGKKLNLFCGRVVELRMIVRHPLIARRPIHAVRKIQPQQIGARIPAEVHIGPSAFRRHYVPLL